jgi:hypothetical protein
MMKNQKGNTLLVLVVIVALVVFAFWWLMKSGYKFPGQTAMAPGIQNTSDLDSASKDLDGTNVNEMDPDMNQLSSDSSSF